MIPTIQNNKSAKSKSSNGVLGALFIVGGIIVKIERLSDIKRERHPTFNVNVLGMPTDTERQTLASTGRTVLS
jgi:hypothetical protein